MQRRAPPDLVLGVEPLAALGEVRKQGREGKVVTPEGGYVEGRLAYAVGMENWTPAVVGCVDNGGGWYEYGDKEDYDEEW